MTVALLIPTKFKHTNDFEKISLVSLTLQGFQETKCPEFSYKVFVGVDFDAKTDIKLLKLFLTEKFPELDFQIIRFSRGVAKGHLSKMWNTLAEVAYDQEFDYFFQCGDDIKFKGAGWVSEFAAANKKMFGLGLVGHDNGHNNGNLQSQAFLSRRHFEIFGFLFPPRLKNWSCDVWLTEVYRQLGLWRKLNKFKAINTSGKLISYTPDRKAKKLCDKLIARDIMKIQTNLFNELVNERTRI